MTEMLLSIMLNSPESPFGAHHRVDVWWSASASSVGAYAQTYTAADRRWSGTLVWRFRL